MKLLTTVTIALALVIPGASAAQTATTLKARPQGSQESSFTKTPDGDYKTTIRRADGSEQEFVVVPSTKVDPKLRADVSVRRTGDGFRTIYTYEVTNGPAAKQELARLFVSVVQPVEVSSLPPGWKVLTPQSPGSVSFHGPLSEAGIPAGLASGQNGNLAFEASALPGVVNVRAAGNTIGAIEVPPGLSVKQRNDLEVLAGRPDMTTVSVPAIGPAIAVGISEPELTFEVVLARVSNHWGLALAKFQHPAAAEVIRHFGNAQRPEATLDMPMVREALTGIKELTRQPVADPWHQQLSTALGVCVDALLSGAVPIK